MIFSLFRLGREVKRSNSAGVLEKVAARNNGEYSEELFLKELENFIGPV